MYANCVRCTCHIFVKNRYGYARGKATCSNQYFGLFFCIGKKRILTIIVTFIFTSLPKNIEEPCQNFTLVVTCTFTDCNDFIPVGIFGIECNLSIYRGTYWRLFIFSCIEKKLKALLSNFFPMRTVWWCIRSGGAREKSRNTHRAAAVSA
jgi:hypothetical protein